MQPELRQIQHEIISQFQIERDQATFELLKMKERFDQQQKLISFNATVDFNAPLVLPLIIPLIIRTEAIDFLLKHHKDLKRKMTLEELMKFSEMYNLVTLFSKNIKSLSDLKQKFSKIKII